MSHESACPHGTCDGDGLIVDEQTNTASPCRCLAETIRIRRLKRAFKAVPVRYSEVSFARNPIADLDSHCTKVLQAYVDQIEKRIKEGEGLWLAGAPGIGKTSAAALVLAHLPDDRSGAFHNAPELFARIRQTIREDSPVSTYELGQQLVDLDLLVIDDLGAVRATDWVLEQLYMIVNGRYNEQRPIIVTTDLTIGQLTDWIGARTVRRLIEMCAGEPLELAKMSSLKAVK